MHLVSAKSFYRSAKRKGPIEDGVAMNLPAKMFVVCDGVSGPYSPSNPVQKYGDLTGGQMTSSVICGTVADARHFEEIVCVLTIANQIVGEFHVNYGKDFSKEAVAGSCVSACQIGDDHVDLVVIGDCFALCRTGDYIRFYTNFDQAAFDFEEKADVYFRECKDKCQGDIGRAWDMYYPYFADKQFFRANRNLGKGGHTVLNGNPTLSRCWMHVSIEESLLPECSTGVRVSESLRPEWILLGTDGLLPQTETNPKDVLKLTERLGNLYESGGINAILEWRDSFPAQPHITGWPEASAVEIKLGYE